MHEEFQQKLKGAGEDVTLEVVPSSGSWTEADPFGSAYIPEQIIRTIVERVSESSGVTSLKSEL
ncbi:MAG: hypothetical protein U5R14_15760 [Gemmatimonadota bacterium]|nr:hypothetical protein [Gemmatimonadota bacterium]